MLPCLWLIAPSSDGLDDAALPALKDAFRNDFVIGAALDQSVFSREDENTARMVSQQFNSISPENCLKWSSIQPSEDTFTFDPADAFVRFGTENDMLIHGHVLVWHKEVPDWVFKDKQGKPASRRLLLKRLRKHIHTVVGRYKGRISSWDVVNEVIEDSGSLRKSNWQQIIGGAFIEKAFTYAHQADPKARLLYNDYNMEMPDKRKRVIRLIRDLRKKGIPVHAVGMQAHWSLDSPSLADIEQSIISYAAADVDVIISELDIDVLPSAWKHRDADLSLDAELKRELDPYPNGLPPDMENKLSQRYAQIFALFRKHSARISNVTFNEARHGVVVEVPAVPGAEVVQHNDIVSCLDQNADDI